VGSEKVLENFSWGVLESPGKVLDFLSVKEWEPCDKPVSPAVQKLVDCSSSIVPSLSLVLCHQLDVMASSLQAYTSSTPASLFRANFHITGFVKLENCLYLSLPLDFHELADAGIFPSQTVGFFRHFFGPFLILLTNSVCCRRLNWIHTSVTHLSTSANITNKSCKIYGNHQL